MSRSERTIMILQNENAALFARNTQLSATILEMGQRIDQHARAAHVDRLLSACLVQRFCEEAPADVLAQVELQIADVDVMKAAIAMPPGLQVVTVKDVERGVWVIALRMGEMTGSVDPGAGDDRTIASISGCSSCGGEHENLAIRPPTEDEERDGVVCVATCPTTGAELAVKPVDAAPVPRPSLLVMP